MAKYKRINIRIHNNEDISYLSNIINRYHVELIERYLDELSLTNHRKIELIDKVINVLKSNNLVN